MIFGIINTTFTTTLLSKTRLIGTDQKYVYQKYFIAIPRRKQTKNCINRNKRKNTEFVRFV